MNLSTSFAFAAPCSAERLIELVKSGDKTALEAVTRCFGERLVAVGQRVCGNEHDADDAVQDALLAAGENLSSFRGEGSLEGWLVKMVVHACKRMHRGQKNDPARHRQDVELQGGEDPEEQSYRGEMVERLGQALLCLGSQDRAVVLLAEADGWTGTEIAGALGMTPVAVRTRLMRARQKVRSLLLEPTTTNPALDGDAASEGEDGRSGLGAAFSPEAVHCAE